MLIKKRSSLRRRTNDNDYIGGHRFDNVLIILPADATIFARRQSTERISLNKNSEI